MKTKQPLSDSELSDGGRLERLFNQRLGLQGVFNRIDAVPFKLDGDDTGIIGLINNLKHLEVVGICLVSLQLLRAIVV